MSEPEDLLGRCDFPAAGTAVTLGVSGGPDSMALLALASCARLVVHVIHVDHGLRPGSHTEADVVAAAAARFGASFESVRVVVADGGNLEARARAARHAALGADSLVGHTMDDRAETVLLHLLRGAGASGLAALRPPDPRRPLLGLRRSETRALCAELDIETVADPSNADPRFTRNRVRAELLPLMADIAGRDIVPLLVRTSELLGADEDALAAQAAALDPTVAAALAGAPVAVAARAVRDWLREQHAGYVPDSSEVARVLEVARGEAVATELVGGARLARHRGRLRVTPPS